MTRNGHFSRPAETDPYVYGYVGLFTVINNNNIYMYVINIIDYVKHVCRKKSENKYWLVDGMGIVMWRTFNTNWGERWQKISVGVNNGDVILCIFLSVNFKIFVWVISYFILFYSTPPKHIHWNCLKIIVAAKPWLNIATSKSFREFWSIMF